ncbi:hypothetical protein J7F01_40335 [Streptomyces sp. ISL-22]|uniref:hypothetical protein n=1 Tax=unclassified Streptomyces TaxID=2593676 RepID=UPI001BE65F93|nr:MULTISPECIES: hypothetical protein [unclassified Streptomyces]MBT2420575.1 hypothetical protein [Streptomyces sp. ISL-24]MBT2438264.1 hypothetical protein [Streptomyces sp. ISL-22]
MTAARPSPTDAYAAMAREAQRLAPVGSNRRKSAGVLAVLLDGAPSIDGARRRLARHRLPAEIRQGAAELLAELTTATQEGVTS